ncbi:MAG: hypothetical protein RL701_6646 [Pseudomonadota bacterium]|jgi:hypothetical protein
MCKAFITVLVVSASQLLACEHSAAEKLQKHAAVAAQEPVATPPTASAMDASRQLDAAPVDAATDAATLRAPASPAEIKRTQGCCRVLERLGQSGGQETVQIGAFAGICDEMVISMEGGYALPTLDRSDSELLHDILSKNKISADCKRTLSKLER